MKELIEQFYQSIRNQSAPPIPYREILLTAQIMDEIFNQIYNVTKAERPVVATSNGENNCRHHAMKYVLITPSRNEEKFIQKTLDSMVAQTLLPVRWVIVDDGSPTAPASSPMITPNAILGLKWCTVPESGTQLRWQSPRFQRRFRAR